MYLKFVSCLCLFLTLFLCAHSQWINSWSSNKQNFNSDGSTFSSWNSNNGFSNSNLGKNKPNDLQPASVLGNTYSSWGSDSLSNKKVADVNSNKNSDRGPNSSKPKKRPAEKVTSSSFGGKENLDLEYNTAFGDGNTAYSAWESNQSPKAQNSGSSGNWQSYAFSSNKSPNEKKLASIMNWDKNKFSSNSNQNENAFGSGFLNSEKNSNQQRKPTSASVQNSGSWNTNSFGSDKSPSNYNDNSVYSSWSSIDQNSKFSTASNENNFVNPNGGSNNKKNSKPNINSNQANSIYSFNSNNNVNSKPATSLNEGNSISSWSSNNNKDSKPVGNSWSSNGNLNSNSISSINEDNLVYSSVDSNSNSDFSSNEAYSPSGSNTNSNSNSGGGSTWQNSNNEISSANKWPSNNKKPANDKKPFNSKQTNTSLSNSWESNTASNKKPTGSENGKKPEKNNQQNVQNNKKDTSILDELDPNDWYFGDESNYPSVPLKSSLNIDLGELWNYDKNKKTKQTSGGNNNNRRRNRETRRFQGKIQCECVNFNLCDEEDVIIREEDLEDDFRPIDDYQCTRITDVCCTNPKMRTSMRANFPQETVDDPLRCGQRRIRKNVIDFEDNVTQPEEFPWNLRLENVENYTDCSASLIHHRVALTAAHCVESMPFDLRVRSALWNTDSEPPQSQRVMKIILHPDYNSKNPRNDIALLVLENPFKLTDKVNTICLPHTNDKWDPNQCFVAAWKPRDINGEIFEELETGVIKFIQQYECQNILLVTDLWRDYILHDSFVCGIEKTKKDSCMGNEGGPVVCPSKNVPNSYVQIGIVSNSMNCDDFGRPGIFTNVLKFLDWINQKSFDYELFDDFDIRSLL